MAVFPVRAMHADEHDVGSPAHVHHPLTDAALGSVAALSPQSIQIRRRRGDAGLLDGAARGEKGVHIVDGVIHA